MVVANWLGCMFNRSMLGALSMIPLTMPKPMLAPTTIQNKNSTNNALKMFKNSLDVYLADLE